MRIFHTLHEYQYSTAADGTSGRTPLVDLSLWQRLRTWVWILWHAQS